MDYNPAEIELKWQKEWEKAKLYQAVDFDKKREKYYLLIEFPYPSGARLHVGHGRSYCAFDALARMKRMQGFNVLFPFGWDAFGLPAENYAIKTGIHPSITTKENINNSKKQAKSWGLSFDWSREINTTDPAFYKWTQWIFLQLFKKGLAYKAKIPVNWCPSCKINLANEEVVAGNCERCGAPVERRIQEQWMLKITAYADRLLNDLESVDYRKDIKQQQINWIGRSEGAKIKFGVISHESLAKKTPDSRLLANGYVEVFTTRPDTLFGATFLVLSPEKAQDYLKLTPKKERKVVEGYIKASLKKSELQRATESGGKTGVFTGIYAQNPITGERIPIWVADFVLSGHGTGAIMAVPAHDQRDLEFAKKFKLPTKEVIKNKTESHFPKEAFTGEGVLVDSGEFSGLHSKEAGAKIVACLEESDLGEPSVDYKLRDWVFSRQHYWGEPIPLVFCERCAEEAKRQESGDRSEGERLNPGWVPVSEKDLPVKLPHLEEYKPIGTGESPLATAEDWVNIKCPKCGGPAHRETDTMPNWAGSSWYYLAYTFWHKLGRQQANKENVFTKYRKELDYWMSVDWYNGGMEHTTLHLLYSRFWYKFLFDLGLVPGPEPYLKRTSHGVILGPDGAKMSKSKGNVVNPDDVVAEFGADAFRVYEMFMGPFDQTIAWDPKGVLGVRRFLDRVWKAHFQVIRNGLRPLTLASRVLQESGVRSNRDLKRELHRLIKKVEEDALSLKFNTAVASLMKFVNQLTINNYQLTAPDWKIFLRVLAPFAPHLSEELWSQVGQESGDRSQERKAPRRSVHQQPWPKYDPKLLEGDVITVVVQVNGKLRGKLEVKREDLPVGRQGRKEKIIKLAKESGTVKSHLSGVRVAKIIFLPDNLVNFVTK